MRNDFVKVPNFTTQGVGGNGLLVSSSFIFFTNCLSFVVFLQYVPLSFLFYFRQKELIYSILHFYICAKYEEEK